MNKDAQKKSNSTKTDSSITLSLVVGSHPNAERDDRPMVYRLQTEIDRAIKELATQDGGASLQMRSQILTDLWFMNDASLVASPAIALGTASTNAAVAHFALQLPQAMVVDGGFEILLDRTAGDYRVCLRGIDAKSTADAVDVFVEKFLADWIESASISMRV